MGLPQAWLRHTQQVSRVTSVLVLSPRFAAGLGVGQSFRTVLLGLGFSQSPELWPREEEVPCFHSTGLYPSRGPEPGGKEQWESLAKRNKATIP